MKEVNSDKKVSRGIFRQKIFLLVGFLFVVNVFLVIMGGFCRPSILFFCSFFLWMLISNQPKKNSNVVDKIGTE